MVGPEREEAHGEASVLFSLLDHRQQCVCHSSCIQPDDHHDDDSDDDDHDHHQDKMDSDLMETEGLI